MKIAPDKLFRKLAAITEAEHASLRQEELERHAADCYFHAPYMPDIIAWPSTAEEVSQVIKLAYAENIPVTSYGSSVGKREYLAIEHSSSSPFMKQIKQVFGPRRYFKPR